MPTCLWLQCNEAYVPRRCDGLSQVNSQLREQLEQAGTANQGLAESLRKAREDMEQKDTRLRIEQEVRGTTDLRRSRRE